MKQCKAFKFNLENADEINGEFSGHAAVFGNVDDGGDVIEKGAFIKTIAEDFHRMKLFFQHNDCDLPIGKPLELREDEKGLFIRGMVSDTQKGRDIKTLLKDGVLDELSIGYEAVSYDMDEQGIRHLREVKLYEVSIVTFAMNEQATIDEVKSLAEGIKSGMISRSRLEALKPFIAVVRELADILSSFPELSPPKPQEQSEQEPPKKNNTGKCKKSSETVFEIIPSIKPKNRR